MHYTYYSLRNLYVHPFIEAWNFFKSADDKLCTTYFNGRMKSDNSSFQEVCFVYSSFQEVLFVQVERMKVTCICMIFFMSLIPKGRSIWIEQYFLLELNTAHRLTRMIAYPTPSTSFVYKIHNRKNPFTWSSFSKTWYIYFI